MRMNSAKLIITLCLFLFVGSIYSQITQKVFYDSYDLKFPTKNPKCLYQEPRTKDIYGAGNGDIYRLNKSNSKWTLVDADPDSNVYPNAEIISMCIDNAGVFYAGSSGNTFSWISMDGGKKWKPIRDSLFFKLDMYNNRMILQLVAHPSGYVFAATDNKIIVTTDHGKKWKEISTSPTYTTVLKTDRQGNLWAGAGANLYISTDLGNTWVLKSGNLEFYSIDDIEFDSKGNIALGKHQELYTSTDGGTTWKAFRKKFTDITYAGPYFIEIAFDEKDRLYAQASSSIGLCVSDNLGESWSIVANQGSTYGLGLTDLFFDDENTFYGISGKINMYNSYVHIAKKISTGIAEHSEIPNTFSLSQNYPNPFNPSTVISYQLTASSHVTLKVFDLLGREVATLVDEFKQAGNYSVEFRTKSAESKSEFFTPLSTGIYFYKLTAGAYSDIKKMVLLK